MRAGWSICVYMCVCVPVLGWFTRDYARLDPPVRMRDTPDRSLPLIRVQATN